MFGSVAFRSSKWYVRPAIPSSERGEERQFVGFRLVIFYVGKLPPEQARQEMGFREEQRGENVWLVLPNDEGVFHGAAERDGVRCVHPIQVYMDLKNHPERSTEAAEQLRKRVLRKGGNA